MGSFLFEISVIFFALCCHDHFHRGENYEMHGERLLESYPQDNVELRDYKPRYGINDYTTNMMQPQYQRNPVEGEMAAFYANQQWMQENRRHYNI